MMSNTEIAISALGLLLGYWLVSFFAAAGKRGKQAPPQAHAAADDGAAPWHQVLQIPADAGPDEIRAAYQAERDKYHPDKVHELGPEFRALAQRKSAEAEAAYRAAMQARGLDA